MLSIGEFSKICMVSTKTLRYYDEIGLISPEYVNQENGYRFYQLGQLKDMLLIIRFKSYGFSLEEILELKNKLADSNFVLEKLKQKKVELKTQEQELIGTVKKIDSDMNSLLKGERIMENANKNNVEMLVTPKINVFSIRENFAIGEFSNKIQAVFKKLSENNLTCIGAPMVLYHDAEFNPEGSDMEICVPVKEKTTLTKDFGGVMCAKFVHKGEYTSLCNSYAFVLEWLEKKNFKIAGSPYDVYVTDPKQVAPEENITEIYFPITKK